MIRMRLAQAAAALGAHHLGPDAEFAGSGRDAVYYVRAIEAPDLHIHGANPLGCRFDERGRCVEITPCGGDTPYEDDCLGEAEARAWSSPIYVNHAGS